MSKLLLQKKTPCRAQCTHGNNSFGVTVRFGGVGEPDPGGGKHDPAGLVRRARIFEKSGGRPITGATYKHVLHVKLAAYTLAPTGSCSSPMLTRHGTHNIAEVRNTHRGARAHDHKVKSLALYRLS